MDQNVNIIGRKEEIQLLRNCYESGKSEMVILYGRRRVGKTYLVKKMFGDNFAFYMTGLYKAPTKRQLANFAYSLSEFTGNNEEIPASWTEAFRRLKDHIKGMNTEGRKVVFIDELPWLDNKRSDLLEAIDLFWNGWGNSQDDLMLILCGSATGWMTDKLLGDKGGLFNRDTMRLYLSPFTLAETELFLHSKNINATRYEIAEYYMVMGGIPYYLDKIQRGFSVAQNIDLMFFKRRGLLWDEFDHLYKTLFADNKKYVEIAGLLSTRRQGYTRNEIAEKLGVSANGDLTKYLNDLCNCDFVMPMPQADKESRDAIYRLTDFYSLFYFRFIEGNTDEIFWSNNIDNPQRRAWSGYAFEDVCLWHQRQIKQALGTAGVSSKIYTYQNDKGEYHAQIDMIIERRDDIVNLCEIKFSRSQYTIDAEYERSLQNKVDALREILAKRQSIHLTMITTFGINAGRHSALVDKSITLDDLFC